MEKEYELLNEILHLRIAVVQRIKPSYQECVVVASLIDCIPNLSGSKLIKMGPHFMLLCLQPIMLQHGERLTAKPSYANPSLFSKSLAWLIFLSVCAN
ncbi:uncharacterized protein LOC113278466 isoform X2 [Papaver somniferum]|nr:uncharacterized protein LOC113278466 isoform X2 [Papaver somniferum]